jgi:CrcB protein
MIQILLISIGGAIGAVIRFSIGKFTSTLTGKSDIFTGTLFSNLMGCFFAGIMLAWVGDNATISQEAILFLSVGILGSITTFSTFALESFQLIESGNFIKTISYLFLQIVISFLMTAGGYSLFQYVLGG